MLHRTKAWFFGDRVRATFVRGAFGTCGSSNQDVTSKLAVYRGSSLGDHWLSSVLSEVSYPSFIASRLTPFPAFVPRVELGGWVPPAAEITYTDSVGSVIRETIPAAEDDEGLPFVPETVESVPREIVNDMARTLRAF